MDKKTLPEHCKKASIKYTGFISLLSRISGIDQGHISGYIIGSKSLGKKRYTVLYNSYCLAMEICKEKELRIENAKAKVQEKA